MIYLDNAATTYPKPEEVYQKIDWANRNIAINAGRGSYKAAQEASRLIEETRRQLIELVHGLGNEHAVLLPSATIALNVILNGLSFRMEMLFMYLHMNIMQYPVLCTE